MEHPDCHIGPWPSSCEQWVSNEKEYHGCRYLDRTVSGGDRWGS